MARLYANEKFPLQVVVALRALGHDVLTVREAGRDNQRIEDADVLAYATRENRAVITINRRDFKRLHRQQPAHCGIIVCSADTDIAGQVQRIHDAINSYATLDGMRIPVNRPH
jgi:predicted nuclease of predicted toxin-antitoxin system